MSIEWVPVTRIGSMCWVVLAAAWYVWSTPGARCTNRTAAQHWTWWGSCGGSLQAGIPTICSSTKPVMEIISKMFDCVSNVDWLFWYVLLQWAIESCSESLRPLCRLEGGVMSHPPSRTRTIGLELEAIKFACSWIIWSTCYSIWFNEVRFTLMSSHSMTDSRERRSCNSWLCKCLVSMHWLNNNFLNLITIA